MGVEPMNTGFADQRVSHFATGALVVTNRRCYKSIGCYKLPKLAVTNFKTHPAHWQRVGLEFVSKACFDSLNRTPARPAASPDSDSSGSSLRCGMGVRSSLRVASASEFVPRFACIQDRLAWWSSLPTAVP